MSCTKTKKTHTIGFLEKKKKKKPNVKINRYIELCNRFLGFWNPFSRISNLFPQIKLFVLSGCDTYYIYIYCEFPKIFT